MNKYKVKDRQTLSDVSLICQGSIESLLDLAFRNQKSITDDLTIGEEVMLDGVAVADKQVLQQYNWHSICPATGITGDLLLEGINFWGIEIDFVVTGSTI